MLLVKSVAERQLKDSIIKTFAFFSSSWQRKKKAFLIYSYTCFFINDVERLSWGICLTNPCVCTHLATIKEPDFTGYEEHYKSIVQAGPVSLLSVTLPISEWSFPLLSQSLFNATWSLESHRVPCFDLPALFHYETRSEALFFCSLITPWIRSFPAVWAMMMIWRWQAVHCLSPFPCEGWSGLLVPT